MLLLHGGPGSTHEYFECLEDFFPRENIEFIYYDQLGSAYSDNITDESLWDMDRPVLKEIKAIEAAKDFGNPRYMELLGPNFCNKFICRLPMDKWPDPVTRAFKPINNKIMTKKMDLSMISMEEWETWYFTSLMVKPLGEQ